MGNKLAAGLQVIVCGSLARSYKSKLLGSDSDCIKYILLRNLKAQIVGEKKILNFIFKYLTISFSSSTHASATSSAPLIHKVCFELFDVGLIISVACSVNHVPKILGRQHRH